MPKFLLVQWFCTVVVALLFSGCAMQPKGAVDDGKHPSTLLPMGMMETAPPMETTLVPRQWQAFCFRMPVNEDTGPRWSLDALLADRIIAPVIYQQGANLPLWRFHRRAADDSAGHQVRFIAYAEPSALKSIESQLLDTPLLAELMSAGYVDRVIASCGPKEFAADIEATSDSNWSIEMQRAWPYFAMGVSATWLKLVEQKSRAYATEPATLDELLSRYDKIQEEVTQSWQKEGQHAFLHHLNALFGYQPLLIQNYLRF